MRNLLITATLLLLLSLKPLFAGVAKGVDVREVQTLLTLLCFNPGPIDGAWGGKTEKAAKDFFSKYFKNYSGDFTERNLVTLQVFKEALDRTAAVGQGKLNRCSPANTSTSTAKTSKKKTTFSLDVPTENATIIGSTLKKLSKKEARELQLSLAQLGLNVGYADGVAGKLTTAALYNYLKENNLLNLKIDKAISKTLQDGKKARRKDAIHFYDNFSSKSLRNYMYPPDVKPNARYRPFTFHESELSGTSLKIKTEPKFNLKNNKADKNWGYGIIEQDRFELTLKKNPRSIEDKPVWIGFRILEGEEFKTHPKARTNIFQIKQHSFGKITSLTVGHKETGGISHKIGHFYQNPNNWKVRKSIKEISASSGTLEPASKYPFSLFINKKHFERSYRKNPDGLPWVSSKNCEIGTVYSQFGLVRKPNLKQDLRNVSPLLNKKSWTTYKIGIFHSKKDTGFLKIYQNDKLIHQYCGPSKMGNSKDEKVDIRIGFYRSFLKDTILNQIAYYDDFTVVGSKEVLDAYLGFGRTKPNEEF